MGTYAVRLDRDVVEAAGEDAEAFLQGQLSQEVAAMAVGSWAWSLLLQPQGKVDAWLRVHRAGADRFVLDVDGGWAEAMVARLERFKLRMDVGFEPLDWSTIGLRGEDISQPGAPVWGLPGVDLVGPDVVVPDGVPELGPDDYEPLRIEAGIPVMGAELTEATIPEEAGIVEASVSFTKGCYVGQELVARIDSRGGNVPRRLRGLVVEGDGIGAGAAVVVGDAEVGKVTSAAWHPARGATVALAYVKRTVEPPAEATVDGAPAEIYATPASRA